MISLRAPIIFRRTVVCLGLLAVALVAAAITMRLAVHGAEVQVPDLRGMTAADAIRKASDYGLSATIADRFYSPSVPMGNVLTQFPEPGTTVRRDWIVRLVQSLGPQTVNIPDVTGMTQRDALIAIRKAHLDTGTVAVVPFASVPAGTVIAQDPPAAAHGVDRPRVALLLASGGPGTSAPVIATADGPIAVSGDIVPDLIGKPFQAAAMAILHAGFKLAPLSDASLLKPGEKPGTVIGQKPAAGTHAAAHTPIQLTVSR